MKKKRVITKGISYLLMTVMLVTGTISGLALPVSASGSLIQTAEEDTVEGEQIRDTQVADIGNSTEEGTVSTNEVEDVEEEIEDTEPLAGIAIAKSPVGESVCTYNIYYYDFESSRMATDAAQLWLWEPDVSDGVAYDFSETVNLNGNTVAPLSA